MRGRVSDVAAAMSVSEHWRAFCLALSQVVSEWGDEPVEIAVLFLYESPGKPPLLTPPSADDSWLCAAGYVVRGVTVLNPDDIEAMGLANYLGRIRATVKLEQTGADVQGEDYLQAKHKEWEDRYDVFRLAFPEVGFDEPKPHFWRAFKYSETDPAFQAALKLNDGKVSALKRAEEIRALTKDECSSKEGGEPKVVSESTKRPDSVSVSDLFSVPEMSDKLHRAILDAAGAYWAGLAVASGAPGVMVPDVNDKRGPRDSAAVVAEVDRSTPRGFKVSSDRPAPPALDRESIKLMITDIEPWCSPTLEYVAYKMDCDPELLASAMDRLGMAPLLREKPRPANAADYGCSPAKD